MFRLPAHLCRLAAYFDNKDLALHKSPRVSWLEVSGGRLGGIKLVCRVAAHGDARLVNTRKFKAHLPAQYLVNAQAPSLPYVFLRDNQDGGLTGLDVRYTAGKNHRGDAYAQFHLPIQDYEQPSIGVSLKNVDAPATQVSTQTLARAFSAASCSTMLRGSHKADNYNYQHVHVASAKNALAIGALDGANAFLWTLNCELPIALPTYCIDVRDARELSMMLQATAGYCTVQVLENTLYITYTDQEYTLQLQVPCMQLQTPSRVLQAPFLSKVDTSADALICKADAAALATVVKLAAQANSFGTLFTEFRSVRAVAKRFATVDTAQVTVFQHRSCEVYLAYLANVAHAFDLVRYLNMYAQNGIVLLHGTHDVDEKQQRLYIVTMEIDNG